MNIPALRSAATALVVATALFSSFFLYTSNRAEDDGFITLRYADHLARGEGFRYNVGGERVEGFSSPLHVLVLGGGIALGADPVPFGQFSSILGLALIAGLLAWWGWRALGPLWGTAAAMAVAVNPGAGHWSRGGLDTTLFAWLALMVLVLNAERRWTAMGVAAGMLALCRPEGVLYTATLLLWTGVEFRRAGFPLKDFARPLLPAVGIPGAWLVFRVLYFHDIFPNTYYAKMDGVRWVQFQRGIEYVGGYLQRSEIAVPLAFVVLAFLVRLIPGRKRPAPEGWPLLALALSAAGIFFSLVAGGDHMAHHRFLMPVTPLLIAAGAWAGRDLATSVRVQPFRTVLVAGLIFLFISQPARIISHDLRHPNFPLDRPVGLVEPLDDYPNSDRVRLGRILGGLLPAGSVIAVVPAGAIPFHSGLTTIDMLGLNDREIGKQDIVDIGGGRQGHEKGNGRIVIEREPDVILMRNFRNPPGEAPAPPQESDFAYRPLREIWDIPEFHEKYEAFVVPIGEGKSFTLHRRR